MATIKRAPGLTNPDTAKRPAHPGRFYMRTFRGTPVLSAWPRKRGTPKNPITLAQNDLMRQLAAALKDVTPADRVAAENFARGSGYAWRDVMSRAMFGRFINIDIWDVVGPQEVLDLITSTPGAMLFRTSAQWVEVSPASEGLVLTFHDVDTPPTWEPSGGGGGGGGVYANTLDGTPSQGSTGLTSTINFGTSSVTDTLNGVAIVSPSGSGSNGINAVYGAVPATPYTLTLAISYAALSSNFGAAVAGWYDGSNKLDLVQVGANSSGGGVLQVANWNSPTSYSSSPFVLNPAKVPDICFIRLSDDGTNVTREFSPDGTAWLTLSSAAKSASWLGASGYTNFAFGTQPNAGPILAVLLDWQL